MNHLASTPEPGPNGLYAENLHHMANYFSFSPAEFQAVAHVLTLGSAVFAAAIFYFILTLRQVSPKYRMTNVISLVVTVSAFFMLTIQAFSWTSTFLFDSESGEYVRKEGHLFSNGFRYMNWAIDVPHLLLQLVIIIPALAMAKKVSYAVQFAVGGLLMVLASWYAAFFENGHLVDGVSPVPFWVWYLVGWAGYVWILVVLFKAIKAGRQNTPKESQPLWTAITAIFLVSWNLYAFALVQPALGAFFEPLWSSESVAARHIIFTFADITSKAVYGVLLSTIAVQVSKREGYDWQKLDQAKS
ncbi:MAG: bacteriorhodopsin [Verrucomicrobiota bacterium]